MTPSLSTALIASCSILLESWKLRAQQPVGKPAIAPSAQRAPAPPPGSAAAQAQRAFVPPPAQDNARRLDDVRGARHEVREGNRVLIGARAGHHPRRWTRHHSAQRCRSFPLAGMREPSGRSKTMELFDSDYKHAGISTTLDSGTVIEGLQAHGFRLALHGHQHVPGIAHISRGIINGSNAAMPQPDLALLSAGSAGARIERLTHSMRDNSYNLLKFARDEIRIDSRCYNAGFLEHGTSWRESRPKETGRHSELTRQFCAAFRGQLNSEAAAHARAQWASKPRTVAHARAAGRSMN